MSVIQAVAARGREARGYHARASNACAHGSAHAMPTPCPDAIACHALKRVTRVP